MEDKTKGISLEEAKVNSLVEQAMKDVSKLEGDIGKVQSRGRLQLNYTPQGFQQNNIQQQSNDVSKLKGNAEFLKTKTLEKIGEVIAKLPDDEKERLKQAATEKLYPKKESFGKKESIENSMSLSANRRFVLGYKPKDVKEAAKANDEKQGQDNKPLVSKFMKDEKLQEVGNQKAFSKFLNYQPDKGTDNKPSKNKDDKSDKDER